MKKTTFIIGRCYTIIVTLFWAACCHPYVASLVAQSGDTFLGLPAVVLYPFIAVSVFVGLLNIFRFRKELPLADSILSAIVPPALAFEMIHIIKYCYAAEIGFDVIVGLLFLVCGIAVAICFIVNTVKWHKKMSVHTA